MADLMLSFVLRLGTMPENSAEEKVFYGQHVKIKDVPFFAFIPACGAAIISPIWIVTSARCITNISVYPHASIWVGGDSLKTAHPQEISETIIHPNYVNFSQHELTIYDIALVKLMRPLNISDTVKTLDLPTNDNFTEDVHTVVGRVVDEGPDIFSLRKLNLYRITKQECLKILLEKHIQYMVPYDRLLSSGAFCAERADIFNMICVGQSGSPVVQNNTLRGIVSFSIYSNCRDSRINFYTDIFYFVKWIKAVTKL